MTQGSVLGDVGRTLSGYVAGQLKVAAVLGCLYSIGYAISGVPFWFILGFLSGALNVIPMIGSLIGLALTAYVVLLNDGRMWNYAGVLVTFVLVQGRVENDGSAISVVGRRFRELEVGALTHRSHNFR